MSKKWGIYPDISKKKLQFTTQLGIRTVLHPYLSQIFRTDEQALRYQMLPNNYFGGTLIVDTTLNRGNKYAEFFETDFVWTRAFPMKNNSEAHESLSLIFQIDGVSPWMIYDRSKYQADVDFVCNCKEYGCYLKQTEPYSPWQNSTKGGIK